MSSIKNNIYTFGSDVTFRSARHKETDLPQPENGVAKCYIIAEHGTRDPILYQNREDLESVILEEINAARIPINFEGIQALIQYYTETWESLSLTLRQIDSGNSRIRKRGLNDLGQLLR